MRSNTDAFAGEITVKEFLALAQVLNFMNTHRDLWENDPIWFDTKDHMETLHSMVDRIDSL